MLKPRSVSPVKTLKLLRDFENLKPRSEQNFTEPYEKDMTSSEESSPMYKKWKAVKMERLRKEHALRMEENKKIEEEKKELYDNVLQKSESQARSDLDQDGAVDASLNE